jgi:hypothetical protein
VIEAFWLVAGLAFVGFFPVRVMLRHERRRRGAR